MSSKQWRADIQGLRAVAVGTVVAAHAGLPGLDGGFIGVDVFFVISGFLITTLLLREVDRTGRVSLTGFYARRARRILPAATLVAVAVLADAALQLPRTRLSDIAHDAGWSSVFLANMHFSRIGTDYFAQTDQSPFQHFWSLAVEEQFYLVWPLLVLGLATLAARRLQWSVRRTVAVSAALILLGSLLGSLHATAASPAAAYFSTPARAYELAAGALLACWGGTLRAPYRGILGMLGVAALVFATLDFADGMPFPGWRALVPVLGAVALLAAGPATGSGRLLSLRPMRALGDISYSLYLWHWPLLVLAPTLLPGSGWWRSALAVLLALGLAALSHRYVEVPFQEKRVPLLCYGRRSLVLWPATVVLVVVSIGVANAYSAHQSATQADEARAWFASHDSAPTPAPAVAKHGRPPSVRPELRSALHLADEGAPIPPSIDVDALGHDVWEKAYPHCYAGDGDTSPPHCALGDAHAKRTVAVVGDSHAGMWLTALDRLGKEQHYRVVPFVKLSCAAYPVYQPAKAMSQGECDAFRRSTTRRLEALHPDSIVVASRGELFMHERGGRSVDEQWSDAVRTAVRDFTRITPDVRLLGDIPAIGMEPDDCLSAPDATEHGCISHPTGPEVHSNALTRAATRHTRATYVDTLPLVCLRRCPLVVGDRVVYHDDAHLTASWVRYVTPRLGLLLGRLART